MDSSMDTEQLNGSSDDDMSDEDKLSSGNESENDEEDVKKTEELENQVQTNPYHYDSHLELINFLRKTGDLEKLRNAREHMSQVFPLTPDLWLEWIKDESRLSLTEDDKFKVLKLFERAVKDYSSVPLWLEYAQFSIGTMSMKDGLENVRQVFEKAVTAVGLHVTEGSLVWAAYTEFETAILSTFQPESETFLEQKQRLFNLFKRQLSVPLFGMEKTYEEFCSLSEGDEMPHYLEQQYEKALAKLRKLKPFEEKIISSEKPHYEAYLSYIEFEEKEGDPARIQSIYERALTDNCLIPHLWLRYTKYLDYKIKIETIVLPVHERSVRNCPWSSDLWISYIKALERFHQPHEKIKETVDNALQAGFTQGQEFQELWFTYIDYLRRRIDWSADHTDELNILRSTVERAVEHVSQYGDIAGPLLKYWAKIEAKFCKNLPRARELWNDVTNHGRATDLQTWLDYANFERAFGDDKHYRKVLLRGLYAVIDWPETIGQLLITFEREEGNLEDLEAATEKYEAHMERVNDKRQKQAKKEAEETEFKKYRKAEMKAEKRKAQEEIKGSTPAKRKMEEEITDSDGFKVPFLPQAKEETASSQDESQPSKKPERMQNLDTGENVHHDPAKDDRTVFLSNLAYTAEDDPIRKIFEGVGEITDVRLARDYKGRSKGFGYLEFSKKEEAEKALELDRSQLEGRPIFVSRCGSKHRFRFGTGMEKNKLFIKNLPFSTTKEEIEEIFKEHGKLKDVRLVTYRNGHSKGLAYVDYEDETSATVALVKTDGMKIGNHTISVAISNPPTRGQKSRDESKEAQLAPVQSLGGGPKEVGLRGRARTQVSLLPRSLQRTQGSQGAGPSTQSQNGSESSDGSSSQKGLSNADFRNLLFKK